MNHGSWPLSEPNLNLEVSSILHLLSQSLAISKYSCSLNIFVLKNLLSEKTTSLLFITSNLLLLSVKGFPVDDLPIGVRVKCFSITYSHS